MARSCAWYRKGKIRALDVDDDEESTDEGSGVEAEVGGGEGDIPDVLSNEQLRAWSDENENREGYEDEDDPPDGDFDLEDEFPPMNFQVLPPEPPSNLPDGDNEADTAGPSSASTHARQREARHVLDDDSDDRVILETEDAGTMLRRVDPRRHFDRDGDLVMDDEPNPFAPFISELDWKLAHWAVTDGPGQNAFDRLLDIPGVVEKLGLSYHNTRALYQKVDSLPEKADKWKEKCFSFPDKPNEIFSVRYRDPLEAIRSLWIDPDLSPHMKFAPTKVFSDETKTNRILTEMWTAKWWHAVQAKLPRGATVAPVIIATDKTQLTQFTGGKAAYPVYLTIGNIPKSIRRKPSKHACVLIAYLSVDKIDRSSISAQEHRSRIHRVFHESMRTVLEPLMDAGKKGVELVSSDGWVRKVYPILASYVADYPEQCLVTCTKSGTCPKCQVKADELQNKEPGTPRTQAWTSSIIETSQNEDSARARYTHCMSQGVSGNVPHPFWTGFPFCDIHRSITPDVLHQLYQGVFKHLVGWCQQILSPQALDRRIRCLPPAYGLRPFKNGISALSQISGPERKNMAKILLGCLVDLMPKAGIEAVTALLDFIYIAQYTAHDSITLGYLQDALDRFYQHRHYFTDVDVRKDFNIPKFHSLVHYINSIQLFGTTDNYNTEMFERLHIDFAKEGWRASNQRDEFPQMTQWLSRQEKISSFNSHLSRISISTVDLQTPLPSKPKSNKQAKPLVSIAKKPDFPNRPISTVEELHNAPDLSHYLKIYLNSLAPQPMSARRLDLEILPLTKINVFKMFRLLPEKMQDDDAEERDIVKAIPKSSQLPNGRFDTVVIMTKADAESTGLIGTRIGRVRVIFTFPPTVTTRLGVQNTPSKWLKSPLAYIEWYSLLKSQPSARQGNMYQVKKVQNAQRTKVQGAVIPLSNIRQSCMLIPQFGTGNIDPDWAPDNVLDKASSFLVNNWASKYSYQTIY